MTKNGFSMISFDAGGTLLRPYPSVGEIYSRVALRYGCSVDPAAIEGRFHELWRQKAALAELVKQSSDEMERRWWYGLVEEIFCGLPGLVEFNRFFDELYAVFADAQSWQLFPEVREVLGELKSRRIRLCVISNWDSRLFRICRGLEIDGYFEFILASAVVGSSKPNPEIFREALKRSGLDPGETLHVGDSPDDDVAGARAAGMIPVLVDRKACFTAGASAACGNDPGPQHVFGDLRGLLMLLPS